MLPLIKKGYFPHFARAVGVLLSVGIAANFGVSQWPAGEQEATTRAVKDAYKKHTIAIRGILPPYSGPPLLLDLFQKSFEEGMCDPQQHVAWESEFNGSMGTSLADPGFSKAADSTATTMVTIDTFAPVYSFPAKLSSAVVIAKPIAGKVCIPQNRKFVYTKFTLRVLTRFKPAHDKRQLLEKAHITAASFGGSIRFLLDIWRLFCGARRVLSKSAKSTFYSCGSRLPLMIYW